MLPWKKNPTDIHSIDELLNQLKIKSNALSEIERDLDPLIPSNDYEAERNVKYEYTDKISIAIFRAQKVLNKNSIVTPKALFINFFNSRVNPRIM